MWRRTPLRPLLIVAVSLASAPLARAEVPEWQLVREDSTLGFAVDQQGNRIEGEFARFDAGIAFSPENLKASKVVVVIDTNSADAGTSERNGTLSSSEFFHPKEFPEARFETKDFTALGGDRYEATAALTIKGVTKTVTLPFTLEIDGDRASMAGALKIDRLDFNIGTGSWANPTYLGTEVEILVDIEAERS